MEHRDRGAFHTSTLPECTQESAALQCLKSKADSPQLLHVLLKPHCCFRQKSQRGTDYKMHFQSITWWTQGPRISLSHMAKAERGQKQAAQRRGQQLMEFNQSQMCECLWGDAGGETRGLARAAPFTGLVCLCVSVVDSSGLLHQDVRKCVCMCICSTSWVQKCYILVHAESTGGRVRNICSIESASKRLNRPVPKEGVVPGDVIFVRTS